MIIVGNNYFKGDKVLYNYAPKAFLLNVGKFSSKLPPEIISLKKKGPKATNKILKLLINKEDKTQ